MTTSSRAEVWNSNTYNPSTGLVKIDTVKETILSTLNSINITLAGAILANISVILTENLTDANVIIRRAILDSGGAIVNSPVILFDGNVDDWSILQDAEQGASLIELSVTSHWAQFEKTAGRRANHSENQEFNPGDGGFEYADQIITELTWGRV